LSITDIDSPPFFAFSKILSESEIFWAQRFKTALEQVKEKAAAAAESSTAAESAAGRKLPEAAESVAAADSTVAFEPNQGSIFMKSIWAENYSNKFQSLNFGLPNVHPEKNDINLSD
jgi:hypothetical protein